MKIIMRSCKGSWLGKAETERSVSLHSKKKRSILADIIRPQNLLNLIAA